MNSLEKDLAEAIILTAKDRMNTERFQNINSAIHAVKLDITQHLMNYMKDYKK